MATALMVGPLRGKATITIAADPTMGDCNVYDTTTAGTPFTLTLPQIGSGIQTVGALMLVEKSPNDTTANTVTFNCYAGDEFDDGTTSLVLPNGGQSRLLQIVSVDGLLRWKIVGGLGTESTSLVPWEAGTPGVLPASSGQHLTTQGGNTLDDGSGNVVIKGGSLDGVAIGATTPATSITTNTLATNEAVTLSGTAMPWLNQNGIYGGSLSGGGNLNSLHILDVIVGDDTGTYPINGFSVHHEVASPAVGGRNAIIGVLQIDANGPNTNTQAAGGVASAGQVHCGGNLGGTAEAPVGQIWGGWFTADTDATYMDFITGVEIDIAVGAPGTIENKLGLSIVLTSVDTVRGNSDDIAFSICKFSDCVNSWRTGIGFGKTSYASWPFDNTSTIISTCSNSGGALPANIGIDFSRVTFSGPAFQTGAAPIAMSEMASAPSGIASTGQLYVASDGSLHYLGPSGTDTRIALA